MLLDFSGQEVNDLLKIVNTAAPVVPLDGHLDSEQPFNMYIDVTTRNGGLVNLKYLNEQKEELKGYTTLAITGLAKLLGKEVSVLEDKTTENGNEKTTYSIQIDGKNIDMEKISEITPLSAVTAFDKLVSLKNELKIENIEEYVEEKLLGYKPETGEGNIQITDLEAALNDLETSVAEYGVRIKKVENKFGLGDKTVSEGMENYSGNYIENIEEYINTFMKGSIPTDPVQEVTIKENLPGYIYTTVENMIKASAEEGEDEEGNNTGSVILSVTVPSWEKKSFDMKEGETSQQDALFTYTETSGSLGQVIEDIKNRLRSIEAGSITTQYQGAYATLPDTVRLGTTVKDITSRLRAVESGVVSQYDNLQFNYTNKDGVVTTIKTFNATETNSEGIKENVGTVAEELSKRIKALEGTDSDSDETFSTKPGAGFYIFTTSSGTKQYATLSTIIKNISQRLYTVEQDVSTLKIKTKDLDVDNLTTKISTLENKTKDLDVNNLINTINNLEQRIKDLEEK